MIATEHRSRHLAWYHANKHKRGPGPKAAARVTKFGVSVVWYLAQWQHQGGRCACCGQSETARGNHGRVKQLAIDHDHVTGAVRELLCQRCNIMVANDPSRLRLGAGYLERHDH